jgi:GTP-binding protein
MKSVIVLVGRPNVGKSTLFNRLTRSRDALVADAPGLTRDRQYGIGRFEGRSFIIVDTGGIDQEREALRGLMSTQTERAISEADAVIFLTDGRSGLCAPDRAIADDLRRTGKPVTVAVNKTEGLQVDLACAEFHALGLGEPVAVSAEHGQGVSRLMEHVFQGLPAPVQEPEEGDESAPCVAIAGRPNVGKSTLVNAMLGEERVVVFDQPGTTRDSIRVPLERDGRHYVLIDTAGVRRRARIDDVLEKFSVVKTLQAIEAANVVVLVLDARNGVSAQDASLAGFVVETGKSLVLAINKWDGLDPNQRAWVRHELDRRLPFLRFLEPHFISALHGSGVGGLFPAIDRAYASAMRELGTSRLNRVLEKAIEATPPPMGRGGRRIKLKFAHQTGKNPPTVRIHGNQVEHLPAAYRRYLVNAFRRAYDLEGTEVRLDLRSGPNPYGDRHSAGTRRRSRSASRD